VQHFAGNNWALGYHQHGARCAEAVIDRARLEVEACDHFGGFMLLQSLAGGTGAGFGSRIAQELYDNLSSAPRLSCAVWPYETGEVIVQAYNTLLSIEKLCTTCDGLMLLQNEELHKTCVVCQASCAGKAIRLSTDHAPLAEEYLMPEIPQTYMTFEVLGK
jgi:tubulin delta